MGGKRIRYNMLSSKFAEANYDYKRGWSTTAQPIADMDCQTYSELAEQSLEVSQNQMTDFAEQHGYSYVVLTQKDLHEFETHNKETHNEETDDKETDDKENNKNESFREWFLRKCEETGQNPKVDLLIVTSCVKDLESANRKSGSVQPDRIIDYQRAMYIVLKSKPNAKKDAKSFQTLSNLIQDIEKDKGTVAIKNHLWEPHVITGFRAHKSLRVIDVPEDEEHAGCSVLRETKIQHESQMEIDRATRPFLTMNRDTNRALNEFNYNAVRDLGASYFDPVTAKSCKHNADRFSNSSDKVTEWSRHLFNRVHKDAGFNVFLNPNMSEEKLSDLTPPSYKDIVKMMKDSVSKSNVPKGILRSAISAIFKANIIPESEIKSAYLEELTH